jgi:hypothetical protein
MLPYNITFEKDLIKPYASESHFSEYIPFNPLISFGFFPLSGGAAPLKQASWVRPGKFI